MTFPDDLSECVRQLARPRLALRPVRQSQDDEVCGVWGGGGVVPLPSGAGRSGRPLRHLVSWPDGPPRLPRLASLRERIDHAGGPGMMPSGETYRGEPYRLLLWTLRDAEPWFEVWGDGASELHAVGRVT